MKLGVNIDHIATLRNARGDNFPSLAYPVGIIEQNGGDFITTHLREDRRHIKDEDLFLINKTLTTYLNLEMACNEDVLARALEVKPTKVTLVPERREEITTEGGLDIVGGLSKVTQYTTALRNAGIKVSLFIEPSLALLDSIIKIAPDDVEIHTGRYANLSGDEQSRELSRIAEFAKTVADKGIKVCAGHGLNYHNVPDICNIKQITELNIGYSIITRSIFTGLAAATREMSDLIKNR